MKLDIRIAGVSQETVGDFKKWTGDCTTCLFMRQRRSEELRMLKTEHAFRRTHIILSAAHV